MAAEELTHHTSRHPQHQQAAQTPGHGANPVRGNQCAVGSVVEAGGEDVVLGHLDKGCREPDNSQQPCAQPDLKKRDTRRANQQ